MTAEAVTPTTGTPPAGDPSGGGLRDADVERVLRAVWGEMLDIEPRAIDPVASFLRLGGDSVLAVRVAAQVRRRLGVVLALADVGVETTLDGLTALVLSRGDSADAEGAPEVLPVELRRRPDPDAPFDLLPLQQAYFVGQHGGWELSYATAHFHSDVGLREVDPDDAPEALSDALERLAAHHPMLRARITADGRQHVLPPGPDATPRPVVHDLRGYEPGAAQAELRRVRAEMSDRGPDPREGPPIQVRLSLLPGGRGRLHTSISLLVIDGWSATVLNRELLVLAQDWNAALDPLEVEFGDYVHSLARLPDSAAWTADRDWWWSRLDGLPAPPALPLAHDPRDVRADTMGQRETTISAERYAALRRQCAQRDTTPSAALSVAFAIVLARWAGHRRMLLNTLQLNRLPLHPDVARVAGAFSSTMLLPVDLAAGRSFAQLAAAGHAALAEVGRHALHTGVEVSRELARRRGSRRPVAPVVFQSTLGLDAAVGQSQPEHAGPLGEVDLADFHHRLRTPQVALEVRVYQLAGELAIVFSLVAELFEAADVDAAFAELVALADSLADEEGWERRVELPAALDPPHDGRLRLHAGDDPADAAAPPPTDQAHAPGAPTDAVETAVAEVFEELLEVPVLDRAADFFVLGGDSLIAVRALALLRRRHGHQVAARDLLADSTVAGVAAAIRRAG